MIFVLFQVGTVDFNSDAIVPDEENVFAGSSDAGEINGSFHEHKIWNELLQRYVLDGKVDYKGLKSNTQFSEYLQSLSNQAPDPSWSRDQQLSYWINAYNAFTMKLIVDNYPLNSIMDLHGGKAWDVKWIDIDSKAYSLNQIENEIIRPQFQEARIHFAVNCAAKSCPPLASKAFTEKNLESLLEQQTVAFINDSNHNKISKNDVRISKIFEWYGQDFGNLINFLNQYSSVKINKSAKVEYQNYDWALNGK